MTQPTSFEARKPRDFGGEGITGSVSEHGRLIAINAYHPEHGYVTLTNADPFPESDRYEPAAVRAYRRALAALSGFGPVFGQPVVHVLADNDQPVVPRLQLLFADGSRAESTTFVHDGGAIQLWRIPEHGAEWSGRLSLQRAAYTQITEGGPLPVPPLDAHYRFAGGILTIESLALGMAAAIAGLGDSEAWSQDSAEPLDIHLPLRPGEHKLTIAFGKNAAAATAKARRLFEADAAAALTIEREYWRMAFADIVHDPLLRRALAYCTLMAVPTGSGSTCLLTDHMLLPLSWNRDAYYMARALLSWPTETVPTREIVRRHLLWLFETAERPGGAWGRSTLANGRVKDAAFQLDQQLWPLLELAEYVQTTGDTATAERFRPQVAAVLEMLMARKSPDALLFPTDETPADDPMTLRYPLSSHILMWRTASKLIEVGLGAGWETLAQDLPATINRTFVTEHSGRALYAYATDGNGQFRLYHDANDFPLALAAGWDFVLPDDPVWRATLDFAWSEANVGGCYSGRLGSVHTPGAWPLGDVQALVVAQATNDKPGHEQAIVRLQAAAQWDGALPEAVAPVTNALISRHWFAWPGAAYACYALDAFEA